MDKDRYFFIHGYGFGHTWATQNPDKLEDVAACMRLFDSPFWPLRGIIPGRPGSANALIEMFASIDMRSIDPDILETEEKFPNDPFIRGLKKAILEARPELRN